MQRLLTCYDDTEDVALGERYGYNVHSPRGYNYYWRRRDVLLALGSSCRLRAGLLRTQEAVSFHKHWMIDPIAVYKKWFEESDRLYANSNTLNSVRNEL
ncbi:hypothetical protein NQ318_022926 [Aromia moschata]|uniref:Uncharacterized protein n=1 Tax=Aromia moschata TaxID=1265417 RepID=A0AAV8X0M6_9CUCU|nr:hypothetical protein NQ318_022926 [Aromia moschata]